MNRTLVVTNDFPPRPGGIQAFVHALASRLPPDQVVVYTSGWRDTETFDAVQPFAVIREQTSVLLPLPAVAGRVRDIVRSERCTSVWFGAALPLALMAGSLRRAGVERMVASTHGHETGWARLPAARQALRRVGATVDALTYVSSYTGERLAPFLRGARARLVHLPPGVDADVFHPECGGAEVRRRYGLGSRPVIVCVSRLMPRKGQDVLIRALPSVRQAIPDAALLLVGGGPDRRRLERLAARNGVGDAVTFTGSVPWALLPAHYDAGDVFAMPCRTRFGGLDVEAFGIVFLEAAAVGKPVVAGRSGGAADAVLDGVTGELVDGRDVGAVAGAIAGLLADADRRAAFGLQGREWVRASRTWSQSADVLAALL